MTGASGQGGESGAVAVDDRYQAMATTEEHEVSLLGKAASVAESYLATICADAFGRLPPPYVVGTTLPEHELRSRDVHRRAQSLIDHVNVMLGSQRPLTGLGVRPTGPELPETSPRPDAAPALSPSGPPPVYLLSPTASPYLPVFEAVGSSGPELAALAHRVGMPEAMFRDAVRQYSIWKLVGEGTARPFTWQSVFDLLVQTLQAAGKDAPEKEVSEATNALWAGVVSVTAKVVQPASGTPVPVGPRTVIYLDDSSVAQSPMVSSITIGTTELSEPPADTLQDALADEAAASRSGGSPADTWVSPHPWESHLDDPEWLQIYERAAQLAWEMVKFAEDEAELRRRRAKEARQRGDEEGAQIHEARARAAEALAERRRIHAEGEQRLADEARRRQGRR